MSLGERWAQFYSHGGSTWPEVVVEEMRRAFYAGGQSMMGLMLKRVEDPDAGTDEGVRELLPILITRLQDDYLDYVDRLLRPVGASDHQLQQTGFAFIGGGSAMFAEFLIATEPDDEDVCVQRMEALQRELDDYVRLFTKRHKL